MEVKIKKSQFGYAELGDAVEIYFYDCFKFAPDRRTCFENVFAFVADRISDALPEKITWDIVHSCLYVEADDYNDVDDFELSDIFNESVTDAMSAADQKLEQDPHAFGLAYVEIDGSPVDWDSAVELMDDAIRESIHADGEEDPQKFLDRYCELHAEKFGEPFTV